MTSKHGIAMATPPSGLAKREEAILRAVAAVQQGTGYGQVTITIKAGRITVVNKNETIMLDSAYDE